MDFRILGNPEVIGDDGPVAIGGRKEQAVLTLLLVNVGTPVSVERIVDELWAEEPPRTAVKTVRSYISRLRRHLGGGAAIETRGSGYTLSAERESIDAARFEDLLDAGLGHQRTGGHMLAAEHLASALAEWRGPALAGLDDHSFAQLEAARLEARKLEALEARIASDLELGRHRRLVSELEASVATHPFHEAFWRQLMLALYRSGRQADALRAYQKAQTTLGEELGIEPSDELRELEEKILLQQAPAAPDTSFEATHNLPAPRDSFIGREAEVEEISRLLGDYRCVTLTGVGGSGKTRLGLEAARATLDSHPDGTRWVELATISDPDAVAEHVMLTFGEPGSHATDPGGVLVDLLRHKNLLLVLDNCEHLVASVAALADRLLDECPGVSVLATSREALGIAGEAIFHVPTLEVPAPDADAAEAAATESARLFADRIRTHHHGFVVNEDNASAVSTICRKLDGIPLALELAAARTRTMDVAELAEQIDDRLQLLTGGARTASPRQRTLRATISWSHDLLTAEAKRGFARLGVFGGRWTTEDVAAVVAQGDVEAARALIDELVDKSLAEPTADGRFRTLETIKEFAFEQLVISGEAPTTGRRHRDRYLEVARIEDPRLRTSDQREAWTRLEADHDNLRAAIQWSLDNDDPDGGLEIIAALGYFWMVRGYWREAWRWLERGLAAPGSSPVARAQAILGEAILEVIRVNFGAVEELLSDARDAFRAAGADAEVARVEALQAVSAAFASADHAVDLLQASYDLFSAADDSWWRAFVARYLGAEHDEPVAAVPLLEESAQRFEALGDVWNAAFSVYYLSGWYLSYDRPEQGRETARAARDLAADVGDVVWHAHALRNLGIAAQRTGHDGEAREYMQQALDRLRLMGDDACTITLNGMLAMLDVEDGERATAARRIAEAMRCAQRLGAVPTTALTLLRAARVSHAFGEVELAARLASVATAELGAFRERFRWFREELEGTISAIEQDSVGELPADDELTLDDAVARALDWALAATSA